MRGYNHKKIEEKWPTFAKAMAGKKATDGRAVLCESVRKKML